MPTRRIDQSDWKAYLTDFSKSRGGLTVSVHTVDPGGERTLIRAEPFVGLSYEEKGSDEGSIILMVGASLDDHEEHVITRPKAMIHKDSATPYSSETNTDLEELEITSYDSPPITMMAFDRSGDARLELNPNV